MRQGSLDADGTAWALRIIVGPVPHREGWRPDSWAQVQGRSCGIRGGGGGDGQRGGGQGDPPCTPALQDDRRPRRGQGAECAEQVARVAFHEGAELGGAGDTRVAANASASSSG